MRTKCCVAFDSINLGEPARCCVTRDDIQDTTLERICSLVACLDTCHRVACRNFLNDENGCDVIYVEILSPAQPVAAENRKVTHEFLSVSAVLIRTRQRLGTRSYMIYVYWRSCEDGKLSSLNTRISVAM